MNEHLAHLKRMAQSLDGAIFIGIDLAETEAPAPVSVLDRWNACSVRRWHTNPHLRDTIDQIDGHSHRVAILALTLKPTLSRDAVIEALLHDLGEHAVGDLAYDAKKRNKRLAEDSAALEYAAIEKLGFDRPWLDPIEAAILKVADWLDAWLWMLRHKPGLYNRADWQDQLQATIDTATECGVEAAVHALVDEVHSLLDMGQPV